MDKIVQIEGVSIEELLAQVKQVIHSTIKETDSFSEAMNKAAEGSWELRRTIDELKVERKFIKRNLTISDRRIAKYERDGVLTPVANAQDAKTTYYLFSDFLRVMEIEHQRLYPNTQ